MQYAVIYEREVRDGVETWGAYPPDLPGCGTVGDSREEVERMIREAIAFHIEGLREAGLPIPEPTSQVGMVEVAA